MLYRVSLWRAIARGDAEAVRRAVAEGASPESRNPQGLTPLMMAANLGFPEVIRALADAGADLDRSVTVSHPVTSGVTALMAACTDSRGAPEPVAVLLELGADPSLRDSAGRTALDYARLSGYDDIWPLLAAADRK